MVDISFNDFIACGSPIIWIPTHEDTRCVRELVDALSAIQYDKNTYDIFQWDCVKGVYDEAGKSLGVQNGDDPLSPITHLEKMAVGKPAIMFAKDFHHYIENPQIIRALKNAISFFETSDKHFVILSPMLKIPPEMEKDIVVCDFDLPGTDIIEKIAVTIATKNKMKLGKKGITEEDRQVFRAAKGMTCQEAKCAISLSLVKHGAFDRETVESIKLQLVKKTGLMDIYPSVNIEELGGLPQLKKYINARKAGFSNPDLPMPRGILMAGLPGAGKSLACKAIASEFALTLLRLDIGSLKASLVGESERKMRDALRIIDILAPCVLWLDEIEKAIGGAKSSNRTDGGTTSAMFGQLLTWMQEKGKGVYIVATCNDIGELLTLSQGALLRRFDDIFFVDLPTPNERLEIAEIMNRRYKSNITEEMALALEGWTGAEIEKLAKASHYDGMEESIKKIKPVFLQNRELLEAVREWAGNNARRANEELVDTNSSSGGDRKLRTLIKPLECGVA